MAQLFVDPLAYDPVYDSEEKENVIWVRRKMGFGTRSRLQDELYKISMKAADLQGGADNMKFEIGVQLQQLLLAIYNIVDWEGPRFMQEKTRQKRDESGKLMIDQRGRHVMEIVTDDQGNPVMIPIPCTRANIELFDPHDPFLEKVLTRIGQNNAPKTTPPKPDNSGGDGNDPLD